MVDKGRESRGERESAEELPDQVMQRRWEPDKGKTVATNANIGGSSAERQEPTWLLPLSKHERADF